MLLPVARAVALTASTPGVAKPLHEARPPVVERERQARIVDDVDAGGAQRGHGGGVHLAVTDDHAELGSEFAAAPHEAQDTRANRSGVCIVGAFVDRLVDGVDQPQPFRSDALVDGGLVSQVDVASLAVERLRASRGGGCPP